MYLRTCLLPLALFACSGDPIDVDTDPDPGTLPASMNFEAGKVTRVVAETVNGAITLQPGVDEGVTIDVIYQDQAESWDYFLQDAILQMWPLCENGVIGCSSGFALGAPATMAADLKTVSGDVVITDYEGAVTIENTQGLITGDGIQGGSIVANGASVTMNLEFASEPTSVDLTTIDGTINLEIPRGTYELDIVTNGNKTIDQLQDGNGPKITVHSTSGDITVLGIQ